MKVYQRLAQLVTAINSDNTNEYWLNRYEDELKRIMGTMPHGSGLDTDCVLDIEKSNNTKLVFNQSYHVMKDDYYTHWINFKVIITPNLGYDFDVKLVGNFSQRNNQDIKEYILDVYSEALNREVKDYAC